MSQSEVYDYLKRKRKDSDDWLSVSEIKEGLKMEGFTEGKLRMIHDDLYRLALFKLIQMRGEGFWKRKHLFRGFKNGK